MEETMYYLHVGEDRKLIGCYTHKKELATALQVHTYKTKVTVYIGEEYQDSIENITHTDLETL